MDCKNIDKMKKICTLFLVFSTMLLFTTCRKDVADKYAGTYLGTLSSQEIVKDSIELRFGVDDSNEEILTMFEHPLKHEIENQYKADESVVLEIIRILYPKTARTQITNTSALFVFEEKEVTMELIYSFADSPENMNMRFIGKKDN